ncbi:MAG: glycosyltransferase family 39 protein [Chloroflexi bacterium]|nr:glycosyltransferase family 39 protein [Chloroflexota bacterium]
MPRRPLPLLWAFLGASLVLLAFVLRLRGLDGDSLWFDEAISLTFARESVPELFQSISQDNHPPLYFILLHLWLPLAGQGEYALRWLSLAPGVAMVALLLPLTLRWSRGLAPPSLPFVAAALASLWLALSPFHRFHSQEVRVYTWATLWVGLSLYALLRAEEAGPHRRRWWVVLALAGALGLYTHYHVGLFLLAATLGWLLLVGPRRSAPGVAALAVSVLAFLPWAPVALARLAGDHSYWPGIPELLSLAGRAFATLSGAAALSPWPGAALAGGTALLLALGILLLWRGARSWPQALFLGAVLILPPLLLLMQVLARPKFDPRYLLPLLAPAAVALGLGAAAPLRLAALPPRMRRLALVPLPALAVLALLPADQAAEWQRPDFRAAVRFVEREAREDDAVVLVGGHADAVWQYYARRSLATVPLPGRLLPDINQPLQRGDLVPLNGLYPEHSRAWLLLWQEELADPRGLVLTELVNKRPRLDVGEEFRGIDLLYFALDAGPPLGVPRAPAQPVVASFAGGLDLLGYDPPGRLDPPQADRPILAVTLYWQAQSPPSEELWSFVHLVDASGRPRAQVDKRVGGDRFPPSRWLNDEPVSDVSRLPLPPDLAPGAYRLVAGLTRGPNGPRLRPGNGEDQVTLGEVVVSRQ